MGCTFWALPAGLTVTVAEPERLLSWVEVAVTVTGVMLETSGAVRTPEAAILPALVAQFTAVL